MKKNLVIIGVALFSCCIAMFGQDVSVNEILNNATTKTEEGNISKAIQLYESIENHGSTDVYYNLGHLYHDNSDFANAALYYEKALKLDAGHQNSINNLSLIREITDVDIIPIEEMFLIRWWKGIAGIFSSDIWMILSLIMALLVILSVYYWWISDRLDLKKKAFVLSIVMPCILGIVLALGSTEKHRETRNDFAIIMNDKFDMHEGADERSPMSKDLFAGTKIVILDQINDWIKVQTADTETGWMKMNEVERI